MHYVVEASPIVSLPIAGDAARFPVHRVYCVGRNYVAHAQEMGYTGRETPFFFLKPADAVVPVPADETVGIDYPPLTKNLHHEIELVVAIGTGGRSIAAADAMAHVFGYAVGLDMTRRDLQAEMKKQGGPWEISKAFEQSAPVGTITRARDVPAIAQAPITLEVNGQPRQASDLSKLVWNIGEIIEHVSNAWTLVPGDLIMTGTPEGVAAVVPGDRLHASIGGLESIDVRIRG